MNSRSNICCSPCSIPPPPVGSFRPEQLILLPAPGTGSSVLTAPHLKTAVAVQAQVEALSVTVGGKAFTVRDFCIKAPEAVACLVDSPLPLLVAAFARTKSCSVEAAALSARRTQVSGEPQLVPLIGPCHDMLPPTVQLPRSWYGPLTPRGNASAAAAAAGAARALGGRRDGDGGVRDLARVDA